MKDGKMDEIKLGVPCSKLKDFSKDAEIPCTDEGEAMAIAAGAWFAGKKPTVYMQNSGLGNIVDIVTSLYKPYNIPLPKLMLSVRCKPDHHKFMESITQNILDLLEYDNVEKVIQDEEIRCDKNNNG